MAERQVAVIREVFALVDDYASLHAALRMRAAQIGVTRIELDEISGVPAGYAAKLLAAEPIKNLGVKSLGPLLGALAIRLAVIEDPEQLARIAGRIHHRSRGAGQPHRPRRGP
jgi:hypothetical protein